MQLCNRSHLNEADLVRMQELILDPAIDINHQEGRLGETPLLLICRANQSESLYSALCILLKNELIDLTAKNSYNQSALTLLCRFYRQNNLINCVKLLIKRKVSVDDESRDGRNAFMVLCEHFTADKLVDIGALLLSNMVDLRSANLSLSILRERGFENESDVLVEHLRSRRSALERQTK